MEWGIVGMINYLRINGPSFVLHTEGPKPIAALFVGSKEDVAEHDRLKAECEKIDAELAKELRDNILGNEKSAPLMTKSVAAHDKLTDLRTHFVPIEVYCLPTAQDAVFRRGKMREAIGLSGDEEAGRQDKNYFIWGHFLFHGEPQVLDAIKQVLP
jgi:hypothetical protein